MTGQGITNRQRVKPQGTEEFVERVLGKFEREETLYGVKVRDNDGVIEAGLATYDNTQVEPEYHRIELVETDLEELPDTDREMYALLELLDDPDAKEPDTRGSAEYHVGLG